MNLTQSNGNVELAVSYSFEEIVATGITPKDRGKDEDGVRRIVTYKCYEPIFSALWELQNKHRNIYNMNLVSKFVSKTGIMQIEKIPEITMLNPQRHKAIWDGDATARKRFLRRKFEFSEELANETPTYISGATFYWVGGKITQISTDLGLSKATVYNLSLLAGMSQVIHWLPSYLVDLGQREVDLFIEWLGKKVIGQVVKWSRCQEGNGIMVKWSRGQW